MRMSLPKDSGWRRIRQPNKQPDPDRADTLTACLKRPRFRKPGFCGTDWDWRLLILVGGRANHNDGEATPEDRKGAGAPPLSTRISTNAQDQSRDAAAPPCSKSPGMAQAASSNPSIAPSCHKPTGYRRLPGGNVGGVPASMPSVYSCDNPVRAELAIHQGAVCEADRSRRRLPQSATIAPAGLSTAKAGSRAAGSLRASRTVYPSQTPST